MLWIPEFPVLPEIKQDEEEEEEENHDLVEEEEESKEGEDLSDSEKEASEVEEVVVDRHFQISNLGEDELMEEKEEGDVANGHHFQNQDSS